MNRRKICVVTGTRAEYGLLYWTIRAIQQSPDLELQLVVTGMHLSPEFGLTYKAIESDGLPINKKIEILLSSDSPVAISKSIGLGVISFAEAFDELRPDVVVLLGDRFEMLAAATSAMINRIPIAHCHGGEITEGAFDESIRHSITKMAHLHFAATEVYRRRIIQLGEQPDRVYNVGALGVENVNRMQLLDRAAFADSIGFELKGRNLLITFHPVTLEFATTEAQFGALLEVLDSLPDTGFIFTKANADTDGRIINTMIDNWVKGRPDRAVAHTSLGQLRYLSALQHVDAVVGNSSSGLIEAPLFNKPTVNIGDRQRGRLAGETVIDCAPEKEAIAGAIEKALSRAFNESIRHAKSPYDNGNSSEKIVEVLRNADLDHILKKRFYDQ